MPSRQLWIVYDSNTGATESWVHAFKGGASACDKVWVNVIKANEVDWMRLPTADGVVFACPELLGSMSGGMKLFFDRAYYPLIERMQGKATLAVVVAGNDGAMTVKQMEKILTGWRVKWIAPIHLVKQGISSVDDLLAKKTLSPHQLEDARNVGQLFAEGLAAGIF
ncbi:NAD(P)H-dependent oxidoreductase [Leeia sp. TBRC 13508]|uniref:NAD(P)H-dependent oxidoreductase n=1 Tax=Leeia speluncae TaxID=2884804 RepID=A0ABS8D5E3_9NEIS|nr:NAD(P)H-dependent oxidoreductase [Leeia speluncae]MCB6183445.1 NAD(P)H-dependent oxidoreductase [Leeia speluncae]